MQEGKRPSIEDLLQHPLVIKHDPSRAAVSPRPGSVQRQGSGCSDEGYASRADSLKRREERVSQREDKVGQREREADDRERRLGLKEKELEGGL